MAPKQLNHKKTAKNNFDRFIKKILAKAATISIMGLVRDDGTTVRLYDQFSLSAKELEHRLITALKMSRLFPPSPSKKNSTDHLLHANEVVISLNTLTNGWHLVVIGNKHSVPGPFPSLCAEYRQRLAKPQSNIKSTPRQSPVSPPAPSTSSTKTAPQTKRGTSTMNDEPQIIGNPNDFFVNPFAEQDDGQADVYLVLDPDNENDFPPSASPAKANTASAQDGAGMIIGDPDLFFTNPFGRHTSQLAVATGQEQHHSVPPQLARKNYTKNG